jgi:hypothetical protein
MRTAMRVAVIVAMTRLLLVAVSLISVTAAQAANTQADFDAAFAAAQTAENEAGSLKNQWIPTEQALAAAKKAASAGDFDTAVSQAKQAEALAKASIAQSRAEDTAWKAAVIH